MSGIECERRQNRSNVGGEVAGEVFAHPRRVVARVEKLHVRGGEEGAQSVVPAACDVAKHRVGSCAHGGQLFVDRQSVRRLGSQPCPELARERRHADHEELVEVVRRDRQEFHPLEQRMRIGPRLIQHAFVECQPAQLAIDVETGIGQLLDAGFGLNGSVLRVLGHRRSQDSINRPLHPRPGSLVNSSCS